MIVENPKNARLKPIPPFLRYKIQNSS